MAALTPKLQITVSEALSDANRRSIRVPDGARGVHMYCTGGDLKFEFHREDSDPDGGTVGANLLTWPQDKHDWFPLNSVRQITRGSSDPLYLSLSTNGTTFEVQFLGGTPEWGY